MTTIAANAEQGVMVCDSRTQIDGMWWPAEKVFRVGRALIGGSGDSAAIRKFVAWYGTNRLSKPKLGDAFNALVLDDTGLYYWCATLVPEKLMRGFHAVGSGGAAALGAMLAGATCREAVHIASQIDTYTGGDIKEHLL